MGIIVGEQISRAVRDTLDSHVAQELVVGIRDEHLHDRILLSLAGILKPPVVAHTAVVQHIFSRPSVPQKLKRSGGEIVGDAEDEHLLVGVDVV